MLKKSFLVADGTFSYICVLSRIVSFTRLKLPKDLRPQKFEIKTNSSPSSSCSSHSFQGFEGFTDGSLEGNMSLHGKHTALISGQLSGIMYTEDRNSHQHGDTGKDSYITLIRSPSFGKLEVLSKAMFASSKV